MSSQCSFSICVVFLFSKGLYDIFSKVIDLSWGFIFSCLASSFLSVVFILIHTHLSTQHCSESGHPVLGQCSVWTQVRCVARFYFLITHMHTNCHCVCFRAKKKDKFGRLRQRSYVGHIMSAEVRRADKVGQSFVCLYVHTLLNNIYTVCWNVAGLVLSTSLVLYIWGNVYMCVSIFLTLYFKIPCLCHMKPLKGHKKWWNSGLIVVSLFMYLI